MRLDTPQAKCVVCWAGDLVFEISRYNADRKVNHRQATGKTEAVQIMGRLREMKNAM